MTTITNAAPAPTTGRPASRRPMDRMRRIALAGGVLYLITFAASLPQLKLFADIVNDPERYVMGHGSNTGLLWGIWFEVITAFAGIGTAVALYPVTRRVSRTAAIGFVTSRVTEAALILVGVVSLLTVVTMRADLGGATGVRAESLRVTAHALVEMRQWTFLVGPGLIAGVNGLFLGYAMYRSRLVPRIIPTVGLIGAPLIIAFGQRHDVRSLGPALGGRVCARPADRRVGVLARSVADRQGLPTDGAHRHLIRTAATDSAGPASKSVQQKGTMCPHQDR